MTTITIELQEERIQQLQQRAGALGISLEELVQISITDPPCPPRCSGAASD